MTKKAILTIMIVGLASATAFATTGAKGLADRIAVRENFPQYAGKVDLRDANNIVNFYYWGGDRCANAVAPSERQIQILLSAHLAGHEVSLDYNDVVSALGNSRCWDGGIQVF